MRRTFMCEILLPVEGCVACAYMVDYVNVQKVHFVIIAFNVTWNTTLINWYQSEHRHADSFITCPSSFLCK